MPVNADSSIVADSTSHPSSPPPTTTPAAKRPLRTYGRPKDTPVYDSDTSFNAATSSASHGSVYRTGPPDLDEEIPPSSDPSRIPSDTELAYDDDDENALQDASPTFEWGWKKKLREMDNGEDLGVEVPAISGHVDAAELREQLQHDALSPQRHIESTSHLISTSPIQHDSNNTLVENVFDNSLTTLAASSLSSIPIDKSPPLSPEVAPARKRPSKRIIQDSDSESEKVVAKSSPANTSPAFPHPIGSSPTNSSPTPPTSDDDMPARPSKSLSRGTRKPAAKARPDVEPLRFSEEPLGVVNRTKNKKSKIKPPTKKEITETARDRLRIAADQQVSIPRVEVSKYTIQNLFASLAAEKKPISQQASILTEPSSDPIEGFSSPHANSEFDVSHLSTTSTGTLLENDGSPVRALSDEPREAALTELGISSRDFDMDSEELPEVGQFVAEGNKKRKQERQRQELLERKQRLLAKQQPKSLVIDDDDDLEIVPTRHSEAVIKKEDAERKLGKKKVSEGRKRQLNFGGIGLAAQKAKDTPVKARKSVFLSGSAKKSKNKKDDGRMSQAELNKTLAMQVMETSKQLSEEKQEEWKRRGGKTIDDTAPPPISFTDVQQAYAKKGLTIGEGGSVNVDEDEEDQSDEDWSPEMRGSASPSPQPEGDEDQEPAEEADITMVNDENVDDMEDEKDNIKTRLPRRSLAVVDSDSETENNDENAPPPRKTPYTFGLPNSSFSMLGSNDENSPLPALSSVRHRGSLSSMDEPTEDENDKENNTALMFDRSDDKENKAVVRHSNTSGKLPLGRRKGSLFDLEGQVERGLSLSPRMETRGIDADDEDDENEDTRKPLKDLLDDDDPFLSRSSALQATPSFTDRLAQSSPAATLPSASLAIVPLNNSLSKGGFSQFSDDGQSTFRGVPLQPGFSDLFESGTEKQKATPLKRPLGLLGSFSDDPEPTGNAFRRLGASLELTQDVTLQPAFQVGDSLLRKADQIFEKEQGYVIEAAAKKPRKKEPELYVNDHGFLTQTRPDVSSPEVYVPPSPSQQYDSTFSGRPESQSTQRRPLRTLSLSGSTSFDSPSRTPLRRLQKGKSPRMERDEQTPSDSPSARKPKLNAFDILDVATKSKAERPKRPLERSEFVEEEAQESDDDEMFGFGHKKVDDGEEDGEDLDKNLETLVDDRDMDEDVVAEELVREKHKEHMDLDDQVLQKIHEDAIHGELRKKRRNHGVGINDSDEDTDDDEKGQRIREGMHKKQKVDRDDIKALAGREETKAFYKVYEHGIMDNDENEFGYLKETQDVVMADQEVEMQQEDEEPPEVISRAEVERLVRERAQQQIDDDPADDFSPHDVSWIDGDESDGNTRVKPAALKKQPGARRRGLNHGDFDAGFEPAPKSELMTEGTMDRLTKWAKVEGRSRNAGTTGRSVGGAAVTGHATRAKTGGGSLRHSAAGSSLSTSESKNAHRKPVKAKASFLKGVVADKSALFDQR